MRKKGLMKYKAQFSIFTLVLFCLTLMPIPNGIVQADTIIKSPVVNSDGTVTFNYQGDGKETEVKVKGEFSNWSTIDMIKGDNNIWSLTIDGKPGISEYGIVSWSDDTVDKENGDWKADPLNPYKKGNNPALVMNPEVAGEEVTFYYLGDGTESRVIVKGSFDKDWGVLHEMDKEENSNIWSVTINVAPRNYEYGIVSWSSTTQDKEWGDWKGDPLNPKHSEEGNFASNALLTVGGESVLKSPEINEDGSVTFRAQYEGESLYLVGSMNNWDNTGIEMKKNDSGIFEVKLELEPGRYEYKFFPSSGSWDNGFTDPLNPVIENENSILVVPGKQEDKIVKVRFVKDGESKYDNWGFWTWYPGEGGKFVTFDYVDKEGAYGFLELPSGVVSGELGIIIKEGQGWDHKATSDLKYEISELNNENNEIVVTYGSKENPKSIEQRAFLKEYDEITLNIHYKRNKGDYDNWNLWSWLDGNDGEKLDFTSDDSYGKVSTKIYENLVNDTKVGFIVKRTDGDNEWAEKDIEDNRFIDLKHVCSDGTLDVYVQQGKEEFGYHAPIAYKEITDLDGQVNGANLYHNTWENVYKYPFGAVAEGTEVTLRMQSQKNDLQYARVLVRNNKTDKSDLYNMEKVATITLEDSSEVDIWEATFTPKEAGIHGYKFIAADGDDIKYYGEDGYEGKTGAVGDKNISFFQLTVYDKDYKTPDWMKEAVVYQIFPDRFFNGDTSNDTAKTNARGDEPIETPESWNSLPDNPRLGENNMNDVDGENYSGDGIWSNDFFGGDIKGIQSKLDYLQSIGVNTLYLNPISMASSNHKYDATDYKKLDPMFGTEADFKEFTSELESRGMKLIVDGVFNHVGDDSVYFDRYGKYETVGAYEYWSYVYDTMNSDNVSQEVAMTKADDYFVKSGQKFSDEKWHLWFNIKNNKVDVGTTNERYEYQAWWGYDSLPEFKSMSKEEAISLGLADKNDEFVNKLSEWNNKALVDYIYKAEDSVAKQWIDWGADGWRLDVANEVETTFWNDFREEMKAHNSETLILGEIWDDASKYFIGDEYDSVMNYRIRAALIDYLKNGNAERLDDTLMAIYEDYPEEAFYALMNLMSSHDVARAVYILGGGSDTAERAEFGTYDLELGKQRLKLASLFEFGYPGAPTIYYGDEAGVVGTKDPDCRRTYPWGNEDESLIDFYEIVGSIRQENKDLLAYGDLTTLYSQNKIYVYGRSYNGEHAIIAINPTDTDATVTIDLKDFTGNGTELVDELVGDYKVTVKDGKATITIPGMTGRMMISSNVVDLPESVKEVTGIEGNGKVSLTWDAVNGAKEYKIYSSSFKGSLQEEVKAVTGTSTTVEGLTNGNKIYFAVSVIDENGNESMLTWSDELIPHSTITWAGNISNVIIDKVDIAAPIEVTSEVFIENISNKEGVSDGLVARLLVKYPGDKDFTIFKAAYNGEKGDNDEFITSFIANKAGIYEYKYEFTTKGVNGFNYEDSIKSTDVKTFELTKGDDVVATELIVLNVPEQQSGEVNLIWSIGETNNVALYEIVRDGVVIARIKDGSITSYKDTDVSNKTEYSYRVIAYTNGGNEVVSNEVAVIPDLVMVEVTFKLNAPAYTPLDTKVTIPGTMNGWNVDSWEMSRNGAVTTDWTYTVSVLEGEEIEYKYVKGGSWDQEALMNYTNPKAANQSKYGCTTGEGGNEKITVVNQGDGKMVVENQVIRWKDMPIVVLDPSTGSYTKNETIIVKGNSMLDPNLTINGEKVNVDENGNFAHEVKLTVGKNELKIHIEPTEENKNNPDIFNNNEEAIGFATKDLTLEITRLGEGEEMPAPTITASDIVVKLGSEFNPLEGVTAKDASGNDITDRIEVVENTVDTSKEGEYKVVFEVVDDNNLKATKEIKVTVAEEVVVIPDDEEENKPGNDTEDESGNDIEVKPETDIEDKNDNSIPNTGGTNTAYIVIGGLVLVCVGAFIVLKKKKPNN